MMKDTWLVISFSLELDTDEFFSSFRRQIVFFCYDEVKYAICVIVLSFWIDLECILLCLRKIIRAVGLIVCLSSRLEPDDYLYLN